MTVAHLDHVQIAIPVGGEMAARAFYGTILGLVELPKPPDLAARGGCWFACGAVQFHLGIEAEFRPARKAHPAFAVSGLAGLRTRLAAAGFDPRDDTPLMDRARLFVADPFGNRIELIEISAASAAR